MGKILVVDDNASLRDMLCVFLKMKSHSVIIAKDGIDGKYQFVEAEPDLVITDYQMPGCDGLELAAWIKKHSPAVPIIMVSASNDLKPPEYIARLFTKPFDLQAVADQVERCLQAA